MCPRMEKTSTVTIPKFVRSPSQQATGPDLKWVDKEKPLFKVSTRLVSTINTLVSVADKSIVQLKVLSAFNFSVIFVTIYMYY